MWLICTSGDAVKREVCEGSSDCGEGADEVKVDEGVTKVCIPVVCYGLIDGNAISV